MKNKILVGLMAAYFCVMLVVCVLKPADEFSVSERRKLEQFPGISADTIFEGTFMTDFESYTLDQFPMRDAMRRIKSYMTFYGFWQKDNNDIYISDGYASKMEYPLRENSLEWAVKKFENVYNRYLADKDMNVYYSIIPDKNYFMAEQSGHLALDYGKLFDKMNSEIDFMEYINIMPLLSIDDYYKTDTHWRQEKITDVAALIGEKMGVKIAGKYKKETLENPFYGVYYGQAALPMESETIYYLTNDVINSCKVFDYENNREISVYDMEKAEGKDPYEMFLSGSLSLISIENPLANTEKELIIFRDSFGSSLAPLLLEGYSKVTLVDIRYMPSEMLGRFIEFNQQDVLFIYSTQVLNNSETIK